MKDYQEYQRKLSNTDYLSNIEARDKLYQKIHNLENKFNFELVDKESMIDDRRRLYEDLKMLHSHIKQKGIHVNSLSKVKDEYQNMKNAKILELKDDNLQQIQDVELRKRKYQILKYQNYLNEEAIHLLWILIVVLLVCCFLVLGNVIGIPYFTPSLVFSIIFTIIGIYGIYLIQKIVVENVNINIYDIHQHNYSKPTAAELARDKSLRDKTLAARSLSSQSQNAGGQCANQFQIEYETVDKIKDEDLEKIKKDIKDNSDDNAQACLKLTVG